MGQDFFEYLPSEIITDILARLPIRSIAISKCVRKSWLNLVENYEFGKFYLSRSAAALAVLMPEENSCRCIVFEFEDEIDGESIHDHRLKHLTEFNFPHSVTIMGSVNGMLLLLINVRYIDCLYVCNPISREYIKLRCLEGFFIPEYDYDGPVMFFGFGASRISGQYKVVQIIRQSDCHVYTLGTGSWRRIEAPSASFSFDVCKYSAFVNGNLHWIVKDLSNGTQLISCFDLETECFSTFSVPPLDGFVEMCALRDCVCLCDNIEDENIIWLMKEYGDEKSWTKEYAIDLNDNYGDYVFVFPIKVFEDGDILMVLDEQLLCYYSKKKKAAQEIGVFDERNDYLYRLYSMLFTPSFLSLKSFRMEDVISF